MTLAEAKNMRATLRIAALVVVSLLSTSNRTQALPVSGVEIHYFASCSPASEVGSFYRLCDGSSETVGQQSGDWKQEIVTDCHGGGQTEKWYMWCNGWYRVSGHCWGPVPC